MMQKKIRMILICFFVLLSLLPYMESEAYNNIQGCIYFYSPTCSSCIRLLSMIQYMRKVVPRLMRMKLSKSIGNISI